VRSALAIVECTMDLKPGPGTTLQVRIGIASGAVVHDPTVSGAQGQITVGQPVSLAARLAGLVDHGAIAIADSTRNLVGELFALEALAVAQTSSPPMNAWRVIGQGSAESRFTALRGIDLVPLVGREQELKLLSDRWEEVRSGEGQAVLLAGEAGIGKSRLVQALREQLMQTPHIYIGCYCSPHRLDSPLHPVIAYLERAANIANDDDPSRRLSKLKALLISIARDTKELIPLFAPLLSIPSDGRYTAPQMGPQLQRERTLTALVDQLARISSTRAVLLVCEDMQWADATSLELLRLVIDRIQGLPVLAIITFRPGFVPPWPNLSHVRLDA